MGRVQGLSAGQELDGKYSVVRELGRGAMGVVYEATHMALGRKVAIKTLLSEMSEDPGLGERFEREARAASAIGHPHIIDVFDLGRTPDGLLYMVMEKLEGASLADMLKEQPRLPTAFAISIMTQVLSGLSAAHKNGIVHRDLKPDNIFVTQSEERPNFVKLVDFGISKVLATATKGHGTRPGHGGGTMVGTVMGTPLYMSPEQAIGQIELIDHRTDIYAAGVVLYEILCGRTPYVGDSYPEIMGGLLEGKYPAPRSLRPDIPAHIESVITRAMQREIEARYPSAAAMRQDLSEGLADMTPPPVITSAGSLGQPVPALRSSSLFSLVEEPQAPSPTDRGPQRRRAGGVNPFAPPDEAEAMIELADDGDLPIAPRSPRAVERAAPPASPVAPAPRTPVPEPRPNRGAAAKAPATMAPEHALPPKVKKYVWKGMAVLAVLVAARVGYSYFRPQGALNTNSSPGGKPTLVIEPEFASVQIDHIPAKAGPLDIDPGRPHLINATAPGRLTRRFSFDPASGGTVTVRLPHAVYVPQATDGAPLDGELVADYPDRPRPFSEIDGAFAKMALVEPCLAAVAETTGAAGRAGKGKPRTEDVVHCQAALAKAGSLPPPMPELEAAGEAYLEALRSAGKSGAVAKTAQVFVAELSAARASWQLEELSALGQTAMSAAWHLRRVTVFASLWQRAFVASPPKPELVASRRAKFNEYYEAMTRHAEGARDEYARLPGAGDVLRLAKDMAAVVDADKRPGEMAALDATRRLVTAFNAVILD